MNRRLPPALPTHSWTEYGDTVETDVVYKADLLDWLYGKERDFCAFCGATIPPISGEGTCAKCESGVKSRTPGLVERVEARMYPDNRKDLTWEGALRAEIEGTE